MHHRTIHDSTSTIEHIVLKPPRARIIVSSGDGFGSYVERLVNVAYETHQSFLDLIRTLNDFIDFLHRELNRTYPHCQFNIIVGKHFDFDLNSIESKFLALIQHAGWKICIFSSNGDSNHRTMTLDDEEKPLVW